jgi:hypothetical protein
MDAIERRGRVLGFDRSRRCIRYEDTSASFAVAESWSLEFALKTPISWG